MSYSIENSIKGKVCLITGGTKGIGKECARQMAKMGAKVIVIGRYEKGLNEVEEELKLSSPESVAIKADISSLAEIKEMFLQVKNRFGTVDVLVNNAGTNRRTKAIEVTEEEWDTIINLNVKGAFFCSQEAAKLMDPGKVNKIINISSQYGHVGSSNRSVYCTSKGAVELLTKSLAVEWAPHILVNAVAPTFIETELTKELFEDEKTRKNLLERIPLKRGGTVKDVVGAILYLASDLSNMTTGSSLLVDGGWTAGS
ncbi:SDR family oxidoreductase [Alkalihalobacillus oceani]|uniref:SDR family NAD(P)-dependent oxidoreductase n=1 Tax=Halalkalibacter oceani TaxID=1653776 RepID=UPI00203C626A|nr:SDR family oxidoreductase [Halalkalibacter oceani]MCM3759608.1 SDR family oxidoreductase [Halalkalibacter oceani]